MTLNVYQYFGDTYYNYYPMIRKMRLIHVEGMGYFVIQSVKEVRGETDPHKEVVCYSAEYMLNYKPVNLAITTMVDGGSTVYARSYKFYDEDYPEDTLMYRLFDGADFYDWSFDYSNIDPTLSEKYRSFDDTGDGLYGFLQNYVSTAYDCVFTYDIENYVVSAHKKEELIQPTDIIISFDNLMKSCELEELSDDIATILSVHGADEMNLTKVNPTGTNNLYKFDYYLDVDWIGPDFMVQSIKYDENGNMVMYGNTPATTRIFFTEHVKLWEEQIKKLIFSSDEPGSYAQLLQTYTYLNTQYNIVSAYHQYADYIYNYCTEALTTYIKEEEQQRQEIKKSSWTSIAIGLGMVAAVVGCVALAAFTGGVSLAAMATAFVSGGAAVASTLGLTGVGALVATVATAAGQAIAITGLSTAFQGLLQLGTTAYQTNVTQEQMKKYQQVAQDNLKTYKSGGGYVYNLTPETLTNIVGGVYNEFVVDEPLYWVSNTIDMDNEESIYQKVPSDAGVQDGVTQIWCLDVLGKKIQYVQEKLQWYVDIYAYQNWFSNREKEVLEPFLIQAEYTDESFVATEDIDITSATDMSQYVVTNQGSMTLEEYQSATGGSYWRYLCGGTAEDPRIDYKATPVTFNIDTFRNWLTQQTPYQNYKNNPELIYGHFYIYYDGQYWTVSRVVNSDDEDPEIINQIRAAYPTVCGISANNHNGNYTYTPKAGDYILLNLYSENLQIVDTVTVATQLAQQGYEILDECSEPTFSFSISCNNFMLMPEYQEWTEQIGFDGSGRTLGAMITVPYESGMVFEPFIQEVSFEYDNPDSLSFTFGNKFNLGTSEYTLGKILSDNTSAVQHSTRSMTAGSYSTDIWNSGNTISSINTNISSSIDRLDPVIESMKQTLEEQKQQLEDLNGQLDQYLEDYQIDKDKIDQKFDLVGDMFTNYTPTQEMEDLIDLSKQEALDQAAKDAMDKVQQNNNGFIMNLYTQITGQQDADREAAEKAALEAYENAVSQSTKIIEEYYDNLTITYDQLDQQIKDVLGEASEVLNSMQAIIDASMENWEAAGALVAGGMGLYCTQIPSGANGGVKLAFHNKPTLQESNIIYYVTSNGIVWTNTANGVTVDNIDAQAQYWGTAMTADGSMVMNTIKAYKITGELITAKTITSEHLAANSVTANNIVAGAITAGKIAAGAIYATNLARDAVFALCYVARSSSLSSGNLYPNRSVSRPDGSSGTARWSDYTGAIIFCYSYQGTGSSGVITMGEYTSVWHPIYGKTKTPMTTYDWASFAYRTFYMNGSYIKAYSPEYLDWSDWRTSGAYTPNGGTIPGFATGLHRHYMGDNQFSTANSRTAVPLRIYGFIMGV